MTGPAALAAGGSLGRVGLRLVGGLGAAGAVLLVVVLAGLQATVPAVAVSPVASRAIPAGLLGLYQQGAQRCPNLAWTVLAAVGAVESDHGRDTATSKAGAVGPMQFLPATWAAYRVDGNADGRTDPREPADAIPAAADYLCTLGAGRDVRQALIAYNCGNFGRACQAASGLYAARVLAIAASYTAPVGDQMSPVAQLAVRAALAQVGTRYLWGGAEPGGFDCSGLVQYAYASAGLLLPRVAAEQYRAGPLLTPGQNPASGDLIFFAAGGVVDHVGLYLGNGTIIDAPHTGALVRIEAVNLASPRLVGITRPAAGTGLAQGRP